MGGKFDCANEEFKKEEKQLLDDLELTPNSAAVRAVLRNHRGEV